MPNGLISAKIRQEASTMRWVERGQERDRERTQKSSYWPFERKMPGDVKHSVSVSMETQEGTLQS